MADNLGVSCGVDEREERGQSVNQRTPMAQEGAQALPLTVPQILAAAQPLDVPISAVYFLIRDGRIVYVGQAIHVIARIITHARAKAFDSWTFIECAPADLDALERRYLSALLPEENRDALTRRLRGDPPLLERLEAERLRQEQPYIGTASAPPTDVDDMPEDGEPPLTLHEAQVEWMRRLRLMKADPTLTTADFERSPFDRV